MTNDTTPSVLFVCVHNAGRSQMAAGYLSALSQGQIEVRSAGSEPAEGINPVAVAAMAEDNIDITGASPKILTTEAVKESDVVITMGCGDACPIFPGKRYEDWQLDDPAGQGIESVRPIRDDIKTRIQALISDLLPASTTPDEDLPVVVIGAGPVGLAAAAHIRERGLTPLVLESGHTIGDAVRQWGHTRLFSPWRFNIDAAAGRLLDHTGWQSPDPDSLPTGHELVDKYLTPLATALRDDIRTGSHVVAVSRKGIDKTRSANRDTTPFLVRIANTDGGGGGGGEDILARSVIDASGTWNHPNPLGRSGLPAPGETEAVASGSIAKPLPAVTGADRQRFAGRHVLVVGAGHSAANTLLDLGELAREVPSTRISWAVRSADVSKVYGGEDNDELAARGALGSRLRALVESGVIDVHPSFVITGFDSSNGRLRVSAGDEALEVDVLVPATGFRPDLSILSELRLDLDPAVEAPSQLGPLIDPEFHSCGSVTPHGERVLSHPEAGFYIVGMKSYGRAPTFLMATGYEQVRSIAAGLAGDHAAAEDVHLSLPETGVCTTDLGGSCDAPVAPEPATAGSAPSSSCC